MSHGKVSHRKFVRRRTRVGFTLVELLVVISIIGMLMALLLPAVNSARETARANTCRNNMRNVALALMQYENAKGEYPALNNAVTIGGTNYNRPLMFYVLPYLERNDLYSQYVELGSNIPQVATQPHYLKILICPSDFQATGDPTSYVFNCGMPNTAGTVSSSEPSEGNAVGGSTPGDQNAKNNGVFFSHRANGTSNSAYITGNDGMATTLLVSENIEAGNWTNTTEILNGFVWHDIGTITDVKINARKGASAGGLATDSDWARPSSNHFGGVNMAFADAHVTFINDTVSYITYAQLMTSAGRLAGTVDSSGNIVSPTQQQVHTPANILDEDSY